MGKMFSSSRDCLLWVTRDEEKGAPRGRGSDGHSPLSHTFPHLFTYIYLYWGTITLSVAQSYINASYTICN